METFSHGTLDPWWVTGLVDGEGSFTFNRNGRQIAVVFQVKLTGADADVLVRLQQFFGVGRIYKVAARTPTAMSGATKTAAMYRVNRHDELPRITSHFDAYPLQSYKANAFKIWRGMVTLKTEFRGRNKEALEELAFALSAAQARNQSWR
jgi:hypothetical protein